MAERDPFDWLGHTIDGRYDVRAVAGSGGFGIVYRGHHRSLDAPVAIKCLKVPQELAEDQRRDFERRFTEEGRVLHRLSRASAAIVQALDVGAATSPNGAWTPYLVLEWLDGTPLDAVLDERTRSTRPRFGLSEAIRLLTPAADALAEAHEQRIAHRDIKPANLFLAKVGDRELLKVLDFGIAKVLHDSLSHSEALRMTGHAPRAFTPQYGAPEQFDRRKGATGPWTDVHALALVLVEMLIGRPAMEGDDVVQLMTCALDPALRPTPRALGVDVGEDVETVLARALAVRSEDRFPDARSFWRALVMAAESRPERSSRAESSADDALETGEFLASLDTDGPPSPSFLGLDEPVSARSVPAKAAPSSPDPVATTSPAILDDARTTSGSTATASSPRVRRPTSLGAFAAVGLLTVLVYGAMRAGRHGGTDDEGASPATATAVAESAPSQSLPPPGADTSAREPELVGLDAKASAASSVQGAAATGERPLDEPKGGRAIGAPSPKATSTATASSAQATNSNDASDDLGPEACGRDCKVDGQCTPKVVAGGLLCRATSDADCKRSYMCYWHGACHAKKGICAALSQADCDASEGCKQSRECALSHGKCVQERYDTDADCRKTPACTRSGRCTAQNNNCIATSEADCRASAFCATHGFCRNLGPSCVK